MKLSTRSTYGIRALTELASSTGHTPLSAASIATRQNLSVAYLEQLLHRLKKGELIDSVRGPRGGYFLSRDPSDISMADVVRLLDGEVFWQEDATDSSLLDQEALEHSRCVSYAVWRCVQERLMSSLEKVTLQDVCDELKSLSGESLEHRFVFHI